jgi:hypothetical protein
MDTEHVAVDDDGEEIQQGPEKDPNDGNDDASDADAEFKAEMAEVKEWVKRESITGVEWEGAIFEALIGSGGGSGGGDGGGGSGGSDTSSLEIALDRINRDLTAVKKQLPAQE